MKAIHYLKVAGHFWPWEYAFWLGLFHDAREDGWDEWPFAWEYFCFQNAEDMRAISRRNGEPYFDYIERVKTHGGDVVRVKRADLVENYKRAWPSLRKRYAKAMLLLAE